LTKEEQQAEIVRLLKTKEGRQEAARKMAYPLADRPRSPWLWFCRIKEENVPPEALPEYEVMKAIHDLMNTGRYFEWEVDKMWDEWQAMEKNEEFEQMKGRAMMVSAP